MTYKVAIYPGYGGTEGGILLGQPIVVALDPVITYIKYPDHPHINLGGNLQNTNIFVPDTLCYIHNPEELGNIIDYRVFEAYKKIAIWLYRHQIWLSMREHTGKGEWIGQGVKLDAKHLIEALDPLGGCRCGKRKAYIDCHMSDDLSSRHSINIERAKEHILANRENIISKITKNTIAPKKKAFDLLKIELLG